MREAAEEVAIERREAVGMPLLGVLAGRPAAAVVLGRVVPKADDRIDPRCDLLGSWNDAGFGRVSGRNVKSEIGGRKPEVGGRKSEIGSQPLCRPPPSDFRPLTL